MSASLPTAGPSVGLPVNPAEPVMGGLLIEVFIACMLYGMTTLQAFIYYQTYPNDSRALKYLVAAVWILETVHTGFCMQFMYSYLVKGFGNYINFLIVNHGIGVTVITSATIALCVQGYYTWRVWIMSNKSLLWTGVIGFFALARVGFGAGSTALSYIYPDWVKLRNFDIALATVSGGLGSAALVDLLVAVTLTFFLKRRSHVYQPQSQSLVNKILLYTVNTGAITGATSLVCVILFAVQKNSLVFLGLVEIQTKLYANSFLGSLNARAHLRNTTKWSRNQYSTTSTDRPAPVVEITRHTITHVEEEAELADLALGRNVFDIKSRGDVKDEPFV